MLSPPPAHAHRRPAPQPGGGALSSAIEDYLKALCELERDGEVVATSALAALLGVSPASATGMLRKLSARGLVRSRRYRGATLTPAGRRAALAVVRAHRLLELLLAERLGVPLEQVHAEADRLEHALSPALAEHIDALLGRPAADPHGAPIPRADGSVAPRAGVPLSRLAPGERATVAELRDDDPDLVRYARELGLLPGARLDVVARAPFEGPLTVRVAGAERVLGGRVLECVWARREEPA